jgi:hypothetical protein
MSLRDELGRHAGGLFYRARAIRSLLVSTVRLAQRLDDIAHGPRYFVRASLTQAVARGTRRSIALVLRMAMIDAIASAARLLVHRLYAAGHARDTSSGLAEALASWLSTVVCPVNTLVDEHSADMVRTSNLTARQEPCYPGKLLILRSYW